MPFADEFMTEEAQQHAAQDMSGVRGAPPVGAAPYPLYGLHDLGEIVPFYKKPLFCWVGGVGLGVGIGWLVFGYLKPRMKPNPKKRAKVESEE